MKSAGKARSNGLYRHIRTSKEIIRNLLNDYPKSMKTKLSPFIVRKTVTGIESMDFRSAPVSFRFSLYSPGFFRFLRL